MNQNSDPTANMDRNTASSSMNATPDYISCPASRDQAIKLYADFIEKESRTYFNMARKSSYMISPEDVIQQGYIILFKVCEKFNAEHVSGSSFRNYLKNALQHELIEYQRADASPVRIPSDNLKDINRAYRRFLQEGNNPEDFTAEEFHRLMPGMREDTCKYTFEAWSMMRNVAPGHKAGDVHEMRDADGLNCISREQAFGDTDDNPATIAEEREMLRLAKDFLESGTREELVYKGNLAGSISDAAARAILGISQPTFRKERNKLLLQWREQLSKLGFSLGA